MDFDYVELVKVTFDRRFTTAVANNGVINAAHGSCVEDQATPVTSSGPACRSIVCGIKCPANAKLVIQRRREDDRPFARSFGNQIRISDGGFDSRSAHLNNHT